MNIAFNIPEGMLWGDYFLVETPTTVVTTQVEEKDDDGWETVGAKPIAEAPKQINWCRHGNACVWRNCPYRHERCQHHDAWIASGKKTRGCRCLTTDPESCKNFEDGGCKYDHRDLTKLRTFINVIPLETEAQIMDAFYGRGLDARTPTIFDVSNMDQFDRELLTRSLKASDIKFKHHYKWIEIHAE